jgi:hypothetical protein
MKKGTITFLLISVLWRMEYGPTKDKYRRDCNKVRTLDSYYSGWILGSTGCLE